MHDAQIHAGKVVAGALQLMKTLTEQGERNTLELNNAAEKYMFEYDVYPSCKGYEPKWNSSMIYQYGTCISVNHEIGHGPPAADKMLVDGDVVKFDIVGAHQGWHVDAAITVPVGNISDERARLIKITKTACAIGIEQAVPGNTVGHITRAIAKVALDNNLGIVVGLNGHGIGQAIHELPNIPNIGTGGNEVLKEGQTICIEPMFTLGSGDNKVLEDGWTIVTIDGSCAAHCEHTVCVQEKPLILTVK
jgi:methionyl aminopeptidase